MCARKSHHLEQHGRILAISSSSSLTGIDSLSPELWQTIKELLPTTDIKRPEILSEIIVSLLQNGVGLYKTCADAILQKGHKLVEDRNLDLTAEIPHGEGRTYLREILLVADHNAYHLGQI